MAPTSPGPTTLATSLFGRIGLGICPARRARRRSLRAALALAVASLLVAPHAASAAPPAGAWGTERQIDLGTVASPPGWRPLEAVALGANRFLAAWLDVRTSTLAGQILDATGAPFGATLTLATGVSEARLAGCANGDAVLAYTRNQTNGPTEVVLRRMGSDGAWRHDPVPVHQGQATRRQHGPVVACGSGGAALVVWLAETHQIDLSGNVVDVLHARRVEPGGELAWDEQTISPNPAAAPAGLATLFDGRFVLVSSIDVGGQGTAYEPWLRLLHAFGGAEGLPARALGGDMLGALSATPEGQILAWVTDPPAACGDPCVASSVALRRFATDLTPGSEHELGRFATVRAAWLPRAAGFAAAGLDEDELQVVWHDAAGAVADISRFAVAAGAWELAPAAVASNPGGTLLAAWLETRGGPTGAPVLELHARTFQRDDDADGVPDSEDTCPGTAGEGEECGCTPGATVGEGAACLGPGGRYAVSVEWTAAGQSSGSGHPIPLTRDSAAFWFFAPANVELLVKVLDGCAVNGHHWVFAAGLTDVETRIRVVDRETATTWSYDHPAGVPFPGVLSTAALPCP